MLINKFFTEGRIHGLTIARDAPIISHLFIADDAYLFFLATVEECVQVKTILQLYHQAFGQVVNFSKSAISFSSSVSVRLRQCLCNEICVNEAAEEGSYLGMPMFVGRKKKAIFAYLKDRVWQKIQVWKLRPSSRAGKEIFIKIVL